MLSCMNQHLVHFICGTHVSVVWCAGCVVALIDAQHSIRDAARRDTQRQHNVIDLAL